MRNPSRKSVATTSAHTGQPGRRRPARSGGPPAEADPGHAQEQVDERRHGQGGAAEHLAAVEEGERDAEGDEHEEVERAQGEGPPDVDEPEEEERREADPHRPRREGRAAERARAAPGHLPCDLRAGPRLDDRAARVGHDTAGDLPRLAGPDMHRPCAAQPVEGPSVCGAGGYRSSQSATFGVSRSFRIAAASVSRGGAALGAPASAAGSYGRVAAPPGRREGEGEERERRRRCGQPAHAASPGVTAGDGTTRACCRRS